MRTLTLSLIGAAALTAGLVLVRQPREPEVDAPRLKNTPAGESVEATISLDRIRELGL